MTSQPFFQDSKLTRALGSSSKLATPRPHQCLKSVHDFSDAVVQFGDSAKPLGRHRCLNRLSGFVPFDVSGGTPTNEQRYETKDDLVDYERPDLFARREVQGGLASVEREVVRLMGIGSVCVPNAPEFSCGGSTDQPPCSEL